MPRAQLPQLGRNEKVAAAKASRANADDRPLLTVTQTAARLHKSRDAVYRLIRQGKLRALMVENTLRVRPGDLDAYLDSQVAS